MTQKLPLWQKVGLVVAVAGTAIFGATEIRTRNAPEDIREAIVDGAGYLVRHLDASGRFEYLVYLDGRRAPEQYNVLRHAGTIYALAQYHQRSPDPAVKETILRASQYLLKRHVRAVPGHAGSFAVYSLPREEVQGPNPEVKLGGCALGLAALVRSWQLDPQSVSPDVLRGLGRFVLAAQDESGRFRSKFNERGAHVSGFDSDYYPGEAILALAMLHEVDPDRRWLDGALRGMAYLEKSRESLKDEAMPPDHWLMIATQAVLARGPLPANAAISREDAIAHVLAIGRAMIRQQEKVASVPGMAGSFVRNGSVTASATRLEGLIALHQLLPIQHPDRKRVRRSIETGMGFVLRGQVEHGSAKGGFTRTFPASRKAGEDGVRRTAAHHEVRIDYVQHALSALVTYDATVLGGSSTKGLLPAIATLH